MIKFSREDRREINLLLTPSWISGLIAIVAGLVVCVGVIAAFEVHNSLVQQQIVTIQQSRPQHTLTEPGQALPENDHPSLKSTWPLLVIWSLVGLAVYIIASSIARSAGQAEELRESLNYVNARPHALLASTAEHLALRLVATGLLIGFTLSIWHQVVPYSITAARASAADLLSLDGVLYALLSFGLIAVSLHI